jgi:hypothetical protein
MGGLSLEAGDALGTTLGFRQLVHDLAASRAIRRWAYGLAEQSGSKVWRSKSATAVELDLRWREVVQASVA